MYRLRDTRDSIGVRCIIHVSMVASFMDDNASREHVNFVNDDGIVAANADTKPSFHIAVMDNSVSDGQ